MFDVSAPETLLESITRDVRDYCLILLDADGRITSWNRGAELTFGHSRSEARGEQIDLIFSTEDRNAGIPLRERTEAAAGTTSRDARWMVAREGQSVFIEGSLTALRDEAGVLLGFLKIGRDVTSEKENADRLRDEEDRYRLLVESARDYAIFMLDPQGTVMSWNRGAERIKQYTAEEVLGRNYSCFFTQEDRDAGKPEWLLRQAAAEGRVQQVGVRQRKDGSTFYADAVLTALYDDEGNVRSYSKVTRDVTERHEAEIQRQNLLETERAAREQLEIVNSQLKRRAREEREFRQLASALTGALDVSDVLLEITSRAASVARADGVYVEKIISSEGTVRVVAVSGRGTPERGTTVPYPGSLTEEILEGKTPMILADMSGFGREMAPYLEESCPDCQILVVPLSADQEPLGALVLLNSTESGRAFSEGDIDRARTLGDLASLALRRVRMIEQETDAREAAENAVRARDEILGIVTHDLRNPLTRILLTLQVLGTEQLPADAQAHLSDLEGAARQMQRLIEDLLDAARIDSGRLSISRDWVPAGELAEEAVRLHRDIASSRGQTLKSEVAGDLPEICVDHGRMLQMFGNLIGNALKFTPDGGTVLLRASKGDDHVLYSVSDSGPGIPEADRAHVFDRYWQAKKTAHLGAGLGLTIVKGIVEAHGGKVWADHGELGGATFSVTVPLPPTEGRSQ